MKIQKWKKPVGGLEKLAWAITMKAVVGQEQAGDHQRREPRCGDCRMRISGG